MLNINKINIKEINKAIDEISTCFNALNDENILCEQIDDDNLECFWDQVAEEVGNDSDLASSSID